MISRKRSTKLIVDLWWIPEKDNEFAIEIVGSAEFAKKPNARNRNFREIFMNSQQINFLFRDSTLNWLSFSRICYLFLEMDLDKLSLSRIHYTSAVFFANSLWIHHLLWEVTMNSLSVLRIHLTSKIFFSNSAWVNYLLCELTLNSLSVSRFEFQSALFIAILSRI